MRTSTALIAVTLVASAAPSFAAPYVASPQDSAILARENQELDARAGGLPGAAAKVVEDTAGDAIKKGLTSGVGSLLGGGLLGGLFGALGDDNSSSRREILEYIEARSSQELHARAGGLAGAAATAVEDTAGDAIKKGLTSGLGSLVGGGVLGGILDAFGSGDNSSKREILEYLEARGNQELHARAGGLPGAAVKAAEDTAGDAIKKGLTSGLGSLVGGGVLGGLLDAFGGGDNSSKREILEYLEARGNQELHARAGGLPGAAAKVVEDTAGDAIKKGLTSGVGSLLGGGLLGGLFSAFGSDDSASKREILEFLEARSNQGIHARASGLAGAAETAVEDTAGAAIKKGLAGGLGSLVGGGVIGGLIDAFGGSDNSTKRDVLEYLTARTNEELAARGIDSMELKREFEARSLNDLDYIRT